MLAMIKVLNCGGGFISFFMRTKETFAFVTEIVVKIFDDL